MKRFIVVTVVVLATLAAVSLNTNPANAGTGTVTTDDQLWVSQAAPTTTNCTAWSSVFGGTTAQKRTMVSFPTSGVVPAGQVVTAATLRVYARNNYSGNNLSVKGYTRTGAINCNLTWNTLGTVGSQVGISSGSFTKNTYKSITLDPASVNTAGRTAFVLDATAASLMEFKADSSVGGFNPSKLDLTWTTSPTTTTVAPTTTTVAPTTTTVAPTTTTTPSTGACVSAHAIPTYGAADDVGPGREDRDTTGTQATTSNYTTVLASAQSGDEVLLRAGTYGNLNVPAGVTVKPYDCESVTASTFDLHSNSTVAGFTVESSTAGWLDRITGPLTSVTIRNMRLLGGTGEPIRAEGDVSGVIITGSIVNGGRDNHGILIGVTGEAAPHPSGVVITNNFIEKTYFNAAGGGEDGVQFQGSQGTNEVSHLSFGKVGEEFVDVKTPSAGVTIRDNDFDNDGPANNANMTPGGGCTLITSDLSPLLTHNWFHGAQGGCILELGGYTDVPNANAIVDGNTVDDTEVLIRQTNGASYKNNVHTRGIFALGTSNNAGDVPTNLTIGGTGTGNTFNGPGTIKVNTGSTYTCTGNTWTGTWAKEGTLTCTNQPVP